MGVLDGAGDGSPNRGAPVLKELDGSAEHVEQSALDRSKHQSSLRGFCCRQNSKRASVSPRADEDMAGDERPDARHDSEATRLEQHRPLISTTQQAVDQIAFGRPRDLSANQTVVSVAHQHPSTETPALSSVSESSI